LAQAGPGPERHQEGFGGGKLIDALGEEGVEQPRAFMRRAAVANPGKTAHQRAEVQHGDGLAELFVQCAQGAEFLGEHGEELALQVLPENRKCERHDHPIATNRIHSNNSSVSGVLKIALNLFLNLQAREIKIKKKIKSKSITRAAVSVTPGLGGRLP
jgi:hypothetical protein